MLARIVVVHDDPEFTDKLTSALRLADYNVTAFLDPMQALDALDAAQRIEVLVTRVQFPPGKPNGITLARMARVKCPGIRVLFTARSEFAVHAEGLGAFMPVPVLVADVVHTVERLLKAGDLD
jgi:DNA-binding NtrC family response regulator